MNRVFGCKTTSRRSVDTSFYRVRARVLVLKYRRTRLNSEVIYSGKDLIRFQKTHDKKGGGQTKNIWREKCFKAEILFEKKRKGAHFSPKRSKGAHFCSFCHFHFFIPEKTSTSSQLKPNKHTR